MERVRSACRQRPELERLDADNRGRLPGGRGDLDAVVDLPRLRDRGHRDAREAQRRHRSRRRLPTALAAGNGRERGRTHRSALAARATGITRRSAARPSPVTLMIVDGVGVFRVDVYLQLMRRLPWNRGSVLGTDPLSVRSLT